MLDFDIIVVGGGLVGATFVLDLAKQNHKLKIAILEPRELKITDLSDKLDSRIYAISPNNLDYLSKIDAIPSEQRMGIIQKMNISGDKQSNLILDAKLVNKFYLAKTIEYSYLQNHLYTKLDDLTNVFFIYGNIENIITNEDNISIICNNNITHTAKLVVAADGANSIVRKYAGVEVSSLAYQQAGIVANFLCELPHKNIAYQWFNGDNILAYLPLINNQISIVWSNPNYQELINLPDNELSELVAKGSQYKLGKLQLLTKAVAFPLKLYLVNKLYSNRIVLIGDAAHTIHPLAGQGVNLGFADARVLASILGKLEAYQLGEELSLAKYNAKRIPDIRQMQLICHNLHNLFNSKNFILSRFRNIGLNCFDSLNFIKKYLIISAIKY